MPGYNSSTLQNPGRSAPVRGVTSQQASTSSSSATTLPSSGVNSAGRQDAVIAMSTLPRSSPNRPDDPQQPNHPLGWERPYSSGAPAAAVAVPIFRAAHAAAVPMAPMRGHRHANAAHLPDSPPDTPPHSPGLSPVRLPVINDPQASSQLQRLSPSRYPGVHERGSRNWSRPSPDQTLDTGATLDAIYTGQTPCDSELESDAGSDFSDDASDATLDQLTQAAQSLLLHAEANKIKSQHHSRSEQTHDPSLSVAHRNTLSAELMPATPEISPDNDVRHHAKKSAHSFLHRIFANVPRNLAVEDAGVELISPGWSGAVIRSGATTPGQASSSFSSNSSSDSSADTQRTLYVSMPPVVDATLLREQVLAVLDAASEKLGCDSVMVCLDKVMHDFASVLHGLCYVGGALVAAAKEAGQLPDAGTSLADADPISGLQLKSNLVLVAIEL
ncbi:Ornithine decarboxylase antizyme [Pseudozyma hubeiensis]|nr:Ornithine decarboxylase antizyme [Pseudozyma hubeiensis]